MDYLGIGAARLGSCSAHSNTHPPIFTRARHLPFSLCRISRLTHSKPKFRSHILPCSSYTFVDKLTRRIPHSIPYLMRSTLRHSTTTIVHYRYQ